MIKRKDLIKVIKGKEVYYKFSEVQKCEEIREEYSIKAIKEILTPYAIRLDGMGNSKWIKEEDLARVNLVAKTVHTEIVSGIAKDIDTSNSALGFAIAFAGADRLGKDYIDKKTKEIKEETIEKYKDCNSKYIKNIEETLKNIERIKEVNSKIKDYGAELIYEINDKFNLSIVLVANNVVRDIYSGDLEYMEEAFIEEDGKVFYYDTFGTETEWTKGNNILWDKDKSFLENALELTKREDVKLTYDSADYWNVDSKNDDINNIWATIELDELYRVFNKELIITYKEDELLDIKEKLQNMSLEGKDFVEAKYRLY